MENVQGLIETGTVLNDNWVILERIGKGGMGEVYRAHQLKLKRDVAIKIVSEEFLKGFGEDDPEIETVRSRFRREVKAMAQVRHPNVVQIFDYGSATIKKGDEVVPIEYFAMEYITGGSLRFTMLEDGFYPRENEVKSWIRDYFFPVLDGVQALHEGGIIHRDLKPENFLLDGNIPKITDFGLSRSFKLESVTESMDVIGTPPYMAPDFFYDFKRVDQRGDIYSLGKILFEAVDGKMPSTTIPFKGAKLRRPSTPFFQALDRIIQDATAEDKNKRPESVERFRNAVQQAIDSANTQITSDALPSLRAHLSTAHFKLLWAGIAVAILSVGAMTAWHLFGDPWRREKPISETGITEQKPIPSTASKPSGAGGPSIGTPAKSVMSKDGLTMHLIPGGLLKSNMGDGQGQDTIQVQPFYLDENKVTVHHFADFLNSLKGNLTVENGVVKRAGEIWMLLGKGNEESNQIIYLHDRFHVRDLKIAVQPVVRVTWYGASAYARQFDKRLPIDHEWEYAAQNVRKKKPSEEGVRDSKTGKKLFVVRKEGGQIKGMDSHGAPKTSLKEKAQKAEENIFPNIDLKNMSGNIKEWVTRAGGGLKSIQHPAKQSIDFSYQSMVIGAGLSAKKPGAQKIERKFTYPWEGFFDVGFRCAADVGRAAIW